MSIRSYPCKVVRVVDGDTVVVAIDAGFRISVTHAVRLSDVNAPEMSTPEGRPAKDFVTAWCDVLTGEWPFTLECHGPDSRDKYGRWVGDILKGEESLSAALLAAGQAVPYPTR